MAGPTVIATMDRTTMTPEPCRLLQLPDEVKLEIVKHVHRRRDLYNLSLACRSLEDMTLSRLYKSIDLDLPVSEAQTWSQDVLPVFRPYVLQNMRELAIRNGISDINNPIYHKRRTSDSTSMKGYVDEIFKGVPQDRLKAFSFLHQTPMSLPLLDSLTAQHGRSLKHFQCCELELLNKAEVTFPSNLRSLECRSVLSGEAITKLIAANKETLRSLSLGQDKYLLQQYRQRRIGFLNNIPQPFEPFQSTLNLSTIPQLRTLSLSGLDLAPITPQTAEAALTLTRLESITLESCPNTAQFLDVLTETFTHVQTSPEFSTAESQIKLKKFSIRHEFVTTPLRDSLIRFLNSFSGLTSLTILVENTNVTTPLSTFLQRHTQTLETLVVESRIQPREHLHIDTSRPFGTGSPIPTLWEQTLSSIASCTNLTELGTAISWSSLSTLTPLNNLKHLKTLHIRNFPVSQTHTQLGASLTTQHAQSLLSTLPGLNLSTLAIGPALYASRWRLGAPEQTTTQTTQPRIRPVHVSQLNGNTRRVETGLEEPVRAVAEKKGVAEYTSTHFFAVDGGLRSIGERELEDLSGVRGIGGVFESVWLR